MKRTEHYSLQLTANDALYYLKWKGVDREVQIEQLISSDTADLILSSLVSHLNDAFYYLKWKGVDREVQIEQLI